MNVWHGGRGMEPDGRKKTILEEVMAHPMSEGRSSMNTQACSVPSLGELEGECYSTARSCCT